MKLDEMTGSWRSSISTGLNIMAYVLVFLSVGMFFNVYFMQSQQGRKEEVLMRSGEIRTLRVHLNYVGTFAERYDPAAPGHDALADVLRSTLAQAATSFVNVSDLNSREESESSAGQPKGRWEQLESAVDKLLKSTSPEDATAAKKQVSHRLDEVKKELSGDTSTSDMNAQSQKDLNYSYYLLDVLALCMLVVAGFMWTMARGLSVRARKLTQVVERISGGELELQAEVSGDDELSAIADSFNDMTDAVRAILLTREKLIESIQHGIVRLSNATAGVVTSTSQHARGAHEQAAAIAETVAAVEEVEQTTRQSAARAAAVAESSQLALDNGEAGRKAVEDTITAMGRVRNQVESIAENILTLAEQAQNIGEIVSSVDHIADQTNLLALNAAIEAARAGEQGKGFTVVANEIRLLADQSKRATVQVRQMLSGIQKLTQRSVLSMEEGTRSVTEATSVVTRADDTIRQLVETVTLAATSAGQILTSANQQSVGMRQIHQAMKNIQEITAETLSATQRAQLAVQELNGLAESLKALVQVNGHVSAESVVSPLYETSAV